MDATPTRLSGSRLTDFLSSLGITKTEPVGRSSDGGEHADEARLVELLQKGDPLSPSSGKVAEDADTVHRLFETVGELSLFRSDARWAPDQPRARCLRAGACCRTGHPLMRSGHG